VSGYFCWNEDDGDGRSRGFFAVMVKQEVLPIQRYEGREVYVMELAWFSVRR